MKLVLNYYMLAMPILWLLVPLASYYDAQITVNPNPQISQLTSVQPTFQNPQQPTFWEFFSFFNILNSWEMFLVFIGSIVGIMGWKKKILWKGKEIMLYESRRL